MITMDYAYKFMDYVRDNPSLSVVIGYFRQVIGPSVVFYPKTPGEHYYSIGLTPALNQAGEFIQRDIVKNRILLVAEASNSSGDYVILEDDTNYMVLSGNMAIDLNNYTNRVIKAITYLTRNAKTLGLTPHDYIMKIAD